MPIQRGAGHAQARRQIAQGEIGVAGLADQAHRLGHCRIAKVAVVIGLARLPRRTRPGNGNLRVGEGMWEWYRSARMLTKITWGGHGKKEDRHLG